MKPAHEAALESEAWRRITSQMNEGFLCGALQITVWQDTKDGSQGVDYSGWWESCLRKQEEDN